MQFPRVHAGLSGACSDKFPSCYQQYNNTGSIKSLGGANMTRCQRDEKLARKLLQIHIMYEYMTIARFILI